METEKTPASPSSAYTATEEDRRLVRDMLAGLPAVQAAREKYLTKWERETDQNYAKRLAEAAFTPLFGDLLFGLSSKPFSKELALRDEASERMKTLSEDIDGEGNNLHVFAQEVMWNGVADGLCAIVVDYPQVPADVRTRADEAAVGVRPYFVRVDACDLLAVYTVTVGGVEHITHARIRETTVERDGWDERKIERIRVLEPGRWELWQETKDAGGRKTWTRTSEGTTTKNGAPLPIVPMVLFYTGKKAGPQMVRPPLVNLARMQVDLFRLENSLVNVENRGAFPMLAANGMQAPTDGNALVVGPMSVLFGGEGGEWAMLEPDGVVFEHFRLRIDAKMQEMRRLGMQPLLPGSGTITATASGIEAAKAHSAVQMWALGLKDALEQALKIMADWMGEASSPEVFVHTDFDVGLALDQSLQTLLAMKEQGVISGRTLTDEMKRRNVLSAEYDYEEDQEERDEEMALLPDIGTGDPAGAQDDTSDDGEDDAEDDPAMGAAA